MHAFKPAYPVWLCVHTCVSVHVRAVFGLCGLFLTPSHTCVPHPTPCGEAPRGGVGALTNRCTSSPRAVGSPSQVLLDLAFDVSAGLAYLVGLSCSFGGVGSSSLISPALIFGVGILCRSAAFTQGNSDVLRVLFLHVT